MQCQNRFSDITKSDRASQATLEPESVHQIINEIDFIKNDPTMIGTQLQYKNFSLSPTRPNVLEHVNKSMESISPTKIAKS